MENDRVDTRTPKRGLENDEISPTSRQDQKKMTSEFEQLKNMFENQMIAMNNFDSKMESMQKNINSIMACNEQFHESLKAMDERVTKTEEEVAALKSEERKHVEETKKELEEVKLKLHHYEQALNNNQLVIRNLPSEIKESKNALKSVVERIFTTLEIDVTENDFEAFAVATSNKNIANIHMKFSSCLLKARIVKKFREMRKQSDQAPFIVEKLIGLPESHELNGKLMTISNKLSQQSTKVLQYARKMTPTPFEFVFDTPDGNLMVRFGGKVHRIDSCDDVDKLVVIAEKAIQKQPKKTKDKATPVTTRAAKKNQGTVKQGGNFGAG